MINSSSTGLEDIGLGSIDCGAEVEVDSKTVDSMYPTVAWELLSSCLTRLESSSTYKLSDMFSIALEFPSIGLVSQEIIPWELGAEKGNPVAELYRSLVGCDNLVSYILSIPNCVTTDKVGGLLAMHIDDIKALAPLWLSKTEEVREDRAHWSTNYTGDIYGSGWISELYGYSFGAAEVGLRHKITVDLMIYPGYVPRPGVEPLVFHYGLPFSVGSWSFSTFHHHEDSIKLVVQQNTLDDPETPLPKIHTVFSTECTTYFDWQTVRFMHNFCLNGQPGNVTRLLSYTDEDLKKYVGHDLAPTHYVPSMSKHPLIGDWYPTINKPAAVLHWLNHANIDAEHIVILDTERSNYAMGLPYGCDNELAKLHTSHPDACEKVGGVIVMHIDDLRKFALLWVHKTEEVQADKAHYAKEFAGDTYVGGWISKMYGYSFATAPL
ncbi:hypothetical protein MKW94_029833, partial [Papaver nudicaule]|nr:hypothetical protein [Papaver nudicaule]